MKAANHACNRILFIAALLGLRGLNRVQACLRPPNFPRTGSLLLIAGTMSVGAANVTKLNTATMNGGAADWSAAPATTDVGEFSATPSAATLAAMSLGGSLTLGGLQLDNNLAGPLTIASGNTLTLGTSGINMSAANTNATINCTLSLGVSPQTWIVASGRTLTIGVTPSIPSAYVLTITGAGNTTVNGSLSPASGDNCGILIKGGNFTASNVTISRSHNYGSTAPTAVAPLVADTGDGFVVTGGTTAAALTTLSIGIKDSAAGALVASGASLTVTGKVLVGSITTSSRWNVFQVSGGSFTATDTVNGIVLSPNNGSSVSSLTEFYLSGGTTTAGKIAFGASTDTVGGNGFLLVKGGNLYVGGGGIVRATTISGYSSTVSLYSGLLGATTNWASPLPMQLSGTTFTFQAADASGVAHNISLSGAISGTGSLVKTGGGVLTLSNANTYSGSTTVSAGLLTLGNASALPKATALTIGSNGNTGTVDLAGFNIQISGLTTAGTAANQIITNSSAANTPILTFSNSVANSTYGGILAGGTKPIALTLLAGNLTFSRQNSYGGNLLISSGKLTLSGTSSTFTGANIVLSNATAVLDISGMGGITLGAGQTLSGYGGVNGNVTAANCPVSPGVTGTAGTLTFSNNLTLNGGVTNHFDLALDPNSSGNDLINVGGALNLAGTNTIQIGLLAGTLSAGTYKLIKFGTLGGGGATNFQIFGTPGPSLQATVSVAATEVDLVVSPTGGSQRLWKGDGLTNAWDFTTTNWLNSDSPDVYADGKFVTFDDTGYSAPSVNLTTTLQPASVTVNATSNYTFSGTGKISGTSAFIKTNTGTLLILTTNNFSGPTTISQGILQLGNGTISAALGTNVIQNSGTLLMNLPGSNSLANVVSGTGRLVQTSSGTLTLTASNTYSGGTTISNGTLQLNPGAWFGSGNVTNNGQLAFNLSGNLTVSAPITGTGAVTLRGGGTLALAGNNAYSGGTIVSNNSTLLVNNSSGSGTIIVTSGSTLGGGGVIGGAVTINSGGIFAPGNPTGTLTVSNNFTAASGAVLNFTLGTTSDKTIVSSNLNLSGTLNISAGTGFNSGTFTLFTYGGALTLGTLTLNLPANSSATINTNTPGQVNLIFSTLQSNIPAFPGALGFGANATGARFGGSVYHVTNLGDSGTGSFRDAVSQPNRFIVFDVGGYITMNSAISCANNLTIAGQTAPGGGIGLMGHELSLSVKTNEIVRFIRIRPGSLADSGDDGINVGDGTNMIFDHISIEFAPYDNVDAVGSAGNSHLITVQNSILGDPIGQQFNSHTEGTGNSFSWCYNILSSAHNRNPLAKINTIFINNVVYNYQGGYTVADTSGSFSHDIINNYFIAGPSTTSAGNDFFQMDNNQSIYSSGNLLDGDENGVLGGSATAPGGVVVLNSHWSAITPTVPTFSTVAGYRYDVSLAGAFPHDQVDQAVIADVTSLGHSGQMWTTQTATGLGNNGYGVITNGIAQLDTDQDGIPDYWELATGSNPNVADSLTPGAGGYTKLENYLNWLAAPHVVSQKNSIVDVDLRQYTGGFTNVSPAYAVLLPTNGVVSLLADGHTAEFAASANFSGLGSFNFSVRASDGSAMTNTVGVLVTVTGLAQNLTWRGDGTANNWDTTSTNWVNGTNRFTFGTGANVTFDDTGSNTPAINLTGALQPASVTVAANQNYNFAGSGSLIGAFSLAKSGAGTLTVGTSNNFSGGTFVSGGSLTMGNTTANASGLGTNTVSLGDGTRLNLFDAGAATDAGTLSNNLAVSGSVTLQLPEHGGAGGATLTGSGNFNLIAHSTLGNFNYDCSGFTGTFNALTTDAGGADFRMGSYAGFAGASVNLSNNINAYFTAAISPGGSTVDFGQINAPASATLRGGPTSGRAVTLRIGALGTDSSFAGAIVEQTVGSTTALVKIGAGALYLGGANSYSGQTVVSNGTLVVNGSTGTNALVIVNGTLGGGGAIGGGVTVYSGNAIAPGTNVNSGTVGTLTITNGLALTNATLYFDLASVTNAGGGVNDLISLSGGALILAGTNTVVPNLLSGFLAAGKYTLISGGSSTAGGAANLLWTGTSGTRQTFSFDTTSKPGSVFLTVAGLPPATLVWVGTNGSAWDVNSTINWFNGSAADKFYDLDNVIFNDTSTNGNVTISSVVQPGQVTVSNSVLNYSIGGELGGLAQLIKSGSGTLTLGGSNSFSGGTLINGGTIILSNDTANQFGLGGGAVTLNNGTLAMFDNDSTDDSAYWNLIVPLNATGMLVADSSCDLYGSLTGGGTFSLYVPSVSTSLDGDWSAFTGIINVISDINGGDFQVNNYSGYPDAAITLSTNINAYFNNDVGPNGTTLQIGALSGVSSSLLLGGATDGNVFTWQIGGLNTDATFSGTITEQTTNTITAIEKIGSGTWTLTGSNSFVGGLSVSGGTLQVNNATGSATGSGQVFVAAGATLSGNGIIGGLTAFDDGATLASRNPSGTLTISNELDLSDLTVLQFGLGTNSDQVVVSGDLTLGGQLNITDVGGFGIGTYTLFTYGGELTLGNVTVASVPAGFVCTISTNTTGQINLVVTRPQFRSISVGTGGLVMNGSGGAADGTFYLLATTNVVLPLNVWTVIATNQFDASGNFNLTNAVDPAAPQSFYRLGLP
jgi:autotransporter-associated beta strand protein